MSDKSNKYGYVGVDIPAQSFGSNKGVFNPAEINELVADNKWTSFGQLELIETQTASGVNSLEFTTLNESIYNVHFMTFNDINFSASSDYLKARYSNDGGTTYESGSNYQRAHQTGNTSPLFAESRGTADTYAVVSNLSDTTTNDTAQGYNYFYSLGDSSKYSFNTMHSISMRNPYIQFRFGSGVYAVAETINAIQIFSNSTLNFTGTISLYGIRYS